jgi:SAM-dependent methyltransferase
MKRGAGGVLEHGVGNGRIALPIARAGIAITGIDHSRPMLDHLAERLKVEKPATRRRVKLVEGDMRTTRVDERFSLVICPFNAALHLYTREDVEAWLDRVREQLAPDGELVFDISMPVPKDLARDPGTPYRVPPFVHPTAGRVSYREHFDYDRVRQILFVSMFFEPVRAKGTRVAGTPDFMTPLAHRQFYPCEMEALLHYNGFEVTALYGDYEEGPLVQTSDVMVWHARPRKTRRGGHKNLGSSR